MEDRSFHSLGRRKKRQKNKLSLQKESGGLWKNSVYVLSVLYSVKNNSIPRFDLTTNPVIANSYAIVVPITLHFPNIKFAGKSIHPWKIFENEFFYSLAVSSRHFGQVP